MGNPSIKYLSVCSGIEAATVAWHPLGWEPVAFSEIEPFPSAVLKYHYPHVPNLGDMNNYHDWNIPTIDLLAGGTPCQSFSVAGLRKGLADPRGNLALVFLGILDRFRPRWVVWENVPGVLSSVSGDDPSAPPAPMDMERDGQTVETYEEYEELHALNCFLAGLSELGYGWAYRVLDAQYFGVPQRRRRPFVVGYLGDWRRATAVLFERFSLQRHSPPRREAREGVAGTLGARAKGGGGFSTDFEVDGGLQVAGTLEASDGGLSGKGGRGRGLIAVNAEAIGALCADCHPGSYSGQDAYTGRLIPEVSHTLTGEGFDASSDGTGRGTPLITVGFDSQQGGDTQHGYTENGAPPVRGQSGRVCVAFAENSRGEIRLEGGEGDRTGNLSSGGGKPGQGGPMIALQSVNTPRDKKQNGIGISESGPMYSLTGRDQHGILASMAVRRLTPRECERLQGLPDDYTLVPFRGKPAKDGPRYKAIGNSWAVPCPAWIGRRIKAVDEIE